MTKMKPKTNGFTLLEVLVTLIILSIGLLGLLSLQIKSLKYTHSSYERTLASIYAKDMAERMWTNLKSPTTVAQPTLPNTTDWTMTTTLITPAAATYPKYTPPNTYRIQIIKKDSRFSSTTSSTTLTYSVKLPRVP